MALQDMYRLMQSKDKLVMWKVLIGIYPGLQSRLVRWTKSYVEERKGAERSNESLSKQMNATELHFVIRNCIVTNALSVFEHAILAL